MKGTLLWKETLLSSWKTVQNGFCEWQEMENLRTSFSDWPSILAVVLFIVTHKNVLKYIL